MSTTISKITTLIVLPLLVLVSSCTKYLDNGTPPGSLTNDKVFTDSAAATSTVLAIYSYLSNASPITNTHVANVTRCGAMSSDEAYFLTSTTYDDFKNNTLGAGNNGNYVWFDAYTNIGRANYIVEGLSATTALSAPLKAQLTGEAKFWRAWLYFYLVNYFGDVPLVTSTDALVTGQLPRTPVADVYKQIIQDLVDAKAALSVNYPTIERARVNKRAVSSFLSRVYLYQQNWAGAEAEATEVISSGTYSLEPNLNNVFLKTSNETIFQIASTTGLTQFGSEYIPAATTPSIVFYDTLANTFETGDTRKINWAKSIVYNSKTYYYPYKYKVRTGTGNEYPIMLRLAEQYLIRSEARAMQNNISGAQADINAVRNRAGLANTTASTQAGMLTALEHERWVELFTEMGDRWINLKRTGRVTAVLSLIKPSWKPFQALYPLPATDLMANPHLVQNPGY